MQAKREAERLLSISKSVESHARLLSDLKIGADAVRKPVEDTMKRSSPGKEMFKIGVALTFLPEPVTVIPGVPLMLAGLAISRMKSSIGIQDVASELLESYQALRNLKLEL